jgi:hypothetical protein
MRRSAKVLWGAVAVVVALPMAAVAVGWFGHNTSGLAPEGMREELAEDIVRQWGPHVESTYRVPASDWAQRMEATFASTDISNLEKAASAATFQQMTSSLLGRTYAAPADNVTPAALGDPGKDLVFTPITPCRIIDTRLVGGPIAAGGTRMFKGFTSTDFTAQGGDASNCGIPLNAAALSAKVVAELPSARGYFTAYPSNEARPLASTLNYEWGQTTSDETHIKLCRPGCASDFSVYSDATSTLVVDVTGYFMEPEATAIDCTVAQQTGNLALLSGLQTRSVSCPAGYTATGGGCGGPLGIGVSNSQPQLSGGQPNGWSCDFVGSLLSVISYQVSATCCRVPGR